MNKMDKKDMKESFVYLVSAYPSMENKNLEGTIRVWYDLFKDVDKNRFQRAVKKSVRMSEFFPTPKLIFDILEQEKQIEGRANFDVVAERQRILREAENE